MARQHAHGVDFWRVHFSTGGDGWYAEGPYAYERTAKHQLTNKLRYADKLEILWPGDTQAAILRTGKIQKLVPVRYCDAGEPGCGCDMKLEWQDIA